jgi:hypothetical protein
LEAGNQHIFIMSVEWYNRRAFRPKASKFELTVAQFPPMSKVADVNRLKTILVMAVLAFWLPATNHCRLELIPGLEFLDCCSHSEDQQASAQHENECPDDLCSQVEDGLYKAACNQIVVEAPPASSVGSLADMLEQTPSPERNGTVKRLDASPPELPKTWQFSFRAAAPPRAPSLVS